MTLIANRHVERQPGSLAAASHRLLRLAKTRHVFVQPASHSEIHQLHLMLAGRIGQAIASAESACLIQDTSPQSIWSMHSATQMLGGIAFLPLNPLGLYQLVYGTLDLLNPAVNSVAARNERPSILYLWALVSRGRGIIGLADVMEYLGKQRFRNVDIWTCPVTQRSERLAERLGFTRFSHGDRVFYRLKRTSPL
jgi:hypothetical protein